MTALQKAIKYLAIAFAIFLIVSIIGGICTGLAGLSSFLSFGKEDPAGEMQVYSVEGEISSLSVKLSGAKLKIEAGDSLFVESNHKYISVKADSGKLTIQETKKFFAYSPNGITVIIHIPEGFVFDDVKMETGAGTVEMDALSADVLELTLGAGKAEIRNLTANSQAKIDGGAGELTIDGGKLCNLDLNMGVGKLTLRSRIEGDSSLEFGVGETGLVLLGSRDDYKIKLEKGIGEARLAGEIVQSDTTYGSGEHFLEIAGGIGAITVTFSGDSL